MAYQSPLGHNFKLEASISAANELKAAETCNSNDSASNDSSINKSSNSNRKCSGNRFSNSPGWQRQKWKSPKSKNSTHNESVKISRYYDPSMLENPWRELESRNYHRI